MLLAGIVVVGLVVPSVSSGASTKPLPPVTTLSPPFAHAKISALIYGGWNGCYSNDFDYPAPTRVSSGNVSIGTGSIVRTCGVPGLSNATDWTRLWYFLPINRSLLPGDVRVNFLLVSHVNWTLDTRACAPTGSATTARCDASVNLSESADVELEQWNPIAILTGHSWSLSGAAGAARSTDCNRTNCTTTGPGPRVGAALVRSVIGLEVRWPSARKMSPVGAFYVVVAVNLSMTVQAVGGKATVSGPLGVGASMFDDARILVQSVVVV